MTKNLRGIGLAFRPQYLEELWGNHIRKSSGRVDLELKNIEKNSGRFILGLERSISRAFLRMHIVIPVHVFDC